MDIDPATLSASVPNLILQPLVENAIRHGIAPRAHAGIIEISAARDHGMVKLKVSDNGTGLPSLASEGINKGIGLSNTQGRLDQLYGVNHSLKFIRVHRSRRVNVRRSRNCTQCFHGDYDLMLRDGTRLETSRGYRDRIQKLLTET